jgi:glycine cleavage system H protein
MSNVPPDLRYAKSHEWVKLESDGTATVGITDYAQNSLGDITFVQLPKVGAAFKAGESFGVVESVKAASDLYAPVPGTVLAVNGALDGAPEQVNHAPFGEGWMLKLKIPDRSAVDALLSADDYAKLLG